MPKSSENENLVESARKQDKFQLFVDSRELELLVEGLAELSKILANSKTQENGIIHPAVERIESDVADLAGN